MPNALPPPTATELRLPDLSRADDLEHPLNRLYGISNYSNSLMNCYAESARRWWQEQDETGDAYRLKANGVEGADDVHKHHVRVRAMHEKTCEEWYQQLDDLAEAVRLAMPDVLLSCKFLPPSERYHRSRKTDWNAFGLEMKRVWIEAKRLTDAAVTGPAPAAAVNKRKRRQTTPRSPTAKQTEAAAEQEKSEKENAEENAE